ISWMVRDDPLYRATWPLAPTGATARFGTVWPATKFRLDAVGRVVWSPYTVTYPKLVGAVTVTLSTTAETPEAGTPPRPVTCNATVPPVPTGAVGAPTPIQVSSNRDGANDPNAPATVGAPAT